MYMLTKEMCRDNQDVMEEKAVKNDAVRFRWIRKQKKTFGKSVMSVFSTLISI